MAFDWHCLSFVSNHTILIVFYSVAVVDHILINFCENPCISCRLQVDLVYRSILHFKLMVLRVYSAFIANLQTHCFVVIITFPALCYLENRFNRRFFCRCQLNHHQHIVFFSFRWPVPNGHASFYHRLVFIAEICFQSTSIFISNTTKMSEPEFRSLHWADL